MKKFIKSVGFAMNGIVVGFKGSNFKVQCAISVLVVFLGFIFTLSKIEWCMIIISIALVTTLELINTAIEQMCDFIHPQKNDTIRDIKDISAGAVLIVSLSSLVIGLVIFLPKFFYLFQN